jgi:uncharacterized caspase-like protein
MLRRTFLHVSSAIPLYTGQGQAPGTRGVQVKRRDEEAGKAGEVATDKPGRRLALLLGNTRYPEAALKNPVHDVADLKERLTGMTFDVTAVCDASLGQTRSSIRTFVSKVRTGDIVFFHYSGHGVQVNQENYLVPVDFAGNSDNAVPGGCIPFTDIKTAIESSPGRVTIFSIDACRSNTSGTRPERRGLAAVEAGLGSYIAFATGPGQTADDNPNERNGLFTKFLLKGLGEPLNISEMFRWVRRQVYEGSGRRQRPYLHDQLIEPLAFHAAAAVQSGADVEKLDATAKQWLEQGRVAFHQGDFERALDLFDRASRQDSANALAHHAAGTALTKLGRHPQALQRFRLAIQLRNDLGIAYTSRGTLYAATGEHDLAIRDFTWAIENDAQDAIAYFRRGRSLFRLRRYEDALEDFSQSIRLNPTDANPYYGRGQVHFTQGQFEAAMQDYNAAILRNANFGEAYRERAVLKARLGDKTGAASDREQARVLGVLL